MTSRLRFARSLLSQARSAGAGRACSPDLTGSYAPRPASTAGGRAGRWTWPALVAGLALVPAVLTLPTPASAQYGYQTDWQRIAYDNGFRLGWEHGDRDARARRSFDERRDRAYGRGDSGYSSRYGDRGRYREVFRTGYVEGYRSGYNAWYGGGSSRQVPRTAPRGQSPSYPGSYPGSYPDWRTPSSGRSPYPGSAPYGYAYGYGSFAFETGYSDGFEKGIEDGRDGDRYDPIRHGRYRDGDRRYDRRYGPREQYKNAYREGFRAGYDRGYREAFQYRGRGARSGSWWPF